MKGYSGRMVVEIDIRKMPEVLVELRHEMAELLREQARCQGDPRVARGFTDVADAFECGQSPAEPV